MQELDCRSIVLTTKVNKCGGFEDFGNMDGFSKVGSKTGVVINHTVHDNDAVLST